MALLFLGLAALAFAVAARADLGRPLLSILAFRLTAQLAMTVGTGSILLTTVLHDTPSCSSDVIRAAGWRGPLLRLSRHVLPHAWLRRLFGVEPPYGPPFLRVLAAVVSREWLDWLPTLGMPSLLALPGTITFKPGAGQPPLDDGFALDSGGWLPDAQELTGVYTYTCRDAVHGDFYYLFRYQAFWMRPAAVVLMHAFGSLLIKMLLMHAYAALFMLLAQGNCRDAFRAEIKRRGDRLQRWLRPRPPVRLIPVEEGDICPFCHEELPLPQADGAAQVLSIMHCRWGCGKPVHRECAARWGRNACVYCFAPMT